MSRGTRPDELDSRLRSLYQSRVQDAEKRLEVRNVGQTASVGGRTQRAKGRQADWLALAASVLMLLGCLLPWQGGSVMGGRVVANVARAETAAWVLAMGNGMIAARFGVQEAFDKEVLP